MRAMRDLIKDRHGTYYAQRKVPERLQRAVAVIEKHSKDRKPFLKKSLGTKVLSQANITAKPVLMEFDRILRAAEVMKDAKPTTRASLSPAEINRMAVPPDCPEHGSAKPQGPPCCLVKMVGWISEGPYRYPRYCEGFSLIPAWVQRHTPAGNA